MPSIFVSIASYRDPELAHTIRSLIAGCVTGSTLAIRILSQGDDPVVSDLSLPANVDIEQRNVPTEASRGVCWARAEIQRAYAGEDYYLQLDSHVALTHGWDETLLADHDAATKRSGRNALLTAYLPAYSLQDGQRPVETTRPVHFKVVQHGWLPTAEQTLGFPHSVPACAPFFSGHFAFACGRFVEDVPYDPELFFFGEEITMALRAYCAGYELFTPTRFVGAHLYARLAAPGTPRPLYWDSVEDASRSIGADELDEASLIKAGAICRGEWRGRFGVRDMARYAAFRAMLKGRFGVDLARAVPPARRLADEPAGEDAPGPARA